MIALLLAEYQGGKGIAVRDREHANVCVFSGLSYKVSGILSFIVEPPHDLI